MTYKQKERQPIKYNRVKKRVKETVKKISILQLFQQQL